jgi:CheY-like chemotaxis protein
VDVIDHGVGIDPQSLSRIFYPFEQAEPGGATTRRFGGLGLGLAIARAVVEMHGGTISAHSDGLGTGSRFSLEFPLLGVGGNARVPRHLLSDGRAVTPDMAEANAADQPASEAVPKRQIEMRVLLVEDHPDTLRALTRLLEQVGYRVTGAENASTALKLASSERFDVVVSDIGLPDASGTQLMRELAKHGLPGIALSGFGMESDLRSSEAAGFAIHLTKPIRLDELDRAIREVTRSRQPTADGGAG